MDAVIITVLAVATLALSCYVFYQMGYMVGTMREKERREAVEARVMERLRIVADGDRELWETEIDA